jgi:hypothetical protein
MITNKEVIISVSKKLMFLVVVVAMLAMMIPMAVPVSAADPPSLAMYLLNPVGTLPTAPGVDNLTLETDPGYNITGSYVRVVPMNLPQGVTVTGWSVTNYTAVNAQAHITASAIGAVGAAYADVTGAVGVASIVATLSAGQPLSIDKKWAQIYNTTITPPQSISVTWNEAGKVWYGDTTVSDNVSGLFTDKDGNPEVTNPLTTPRGQEPLTGAILHWYLINGNTVSSIPMTAGYFPGPTGLDYYFSHLAKPIFTTITGGMAPTMTTTFTTPTGMNSIALHATGEEPVWVVVVPEYPNTTDVLVTPEVTSVNFWTSEMEVVPQVRWVGEKIVLEKFFGVELAGHLVHFSLNMQNATLEGLQGSQLGNLNNTTTSVWDVVSTTGWARCMLVAQDPGEVIVNLALYSFGSGAGTPDNSKILNQHEFDVYYLKLESITLGNVLGKRAGHDSGPFDLPNNNPVWDIGTPNQPNVTPDEVTGNLNVSQDTLLRARVKGYFMGDRLSTRLAVTQDADPTHPGVYTYTLPAGRWVLPDDWAVLAGPNWDEQRIHWDIMNNPGDGLAGVVDDTTAGTAMAGVGPYVMEGIADTLVAAAPVIGPFTPELEVPTAMGYNPNITIHGYRGPAAPVIDRKTVVPNGALDWWDAPMPPAKITFKMLNAPFTSDNMTMANVGYFKEAIKSDIYYVMDGPVMDLTNPFYWAMVPANFEIPAFVNNGGYDWDSWNSSYGPYQFWKIFNRPANNDLPARNNSLYPAKAQVYSDNHGEAMIYLNGNYNLNAQMFTFKGQDVAFGDTVGSTTVVAMADYPYFRADGQLISNTVTKTWTWGGMVLGPTETTHEMILSVGNYTATSAINGTSKDKMVWVWATDRDGEQSGVLGTQVDWSITPVGTTTAIIPDLTTTTVMNGMIPSGGVSNFNDTMKEINITHGFLNNTMGGVVNTPAGPVIRSWMRAPTAAEKMLFNKFWGVGGTNTIIGADGKALDPNDFAVAAIDLYDSTMSADVTVNAFLTSMDFGTIAYTWNVNFTMSHPLDDVVTAGDANQDGQVTMADVTAIERIILGMDAPSYQADANGNGVINMGDVVKAERIVLGAK